MNREKSDLEEAKRLNKQAASGMTNSTSSSFTNSAASDSDLQEARKANAKSRSKKGMQ